MSRDFDQEIAAQEARMANIRQQMERDPNSCLDPIGLSSTFHRMWMRSREQFRASTGPLSSTTTPFAFSNSTKLHLRERSRPLDVRVQPGLYPNLRCRFIFTIAVLRALSSVSRAARNTD